MRERGSQGEGNVGVQIVPLPRNPRVVAWASAQAAATSRHAAYGRASYAR
jgi:hypothetical protein